MLPFRGARSKTFWTGPNEGPHHLHSQTFTKTTMNQNLAVQQLVKSSTEADRAQGRAVALVLRKVAEIEAAGARSVKAACQTLIGNARAGLVLPKFLENMRAARDKRGRSSPDGLPSPRTLEWWVMRDKRGESLVPKKPQPRTVLTSWMVVALELKRGPQKPTTKKVHEQLAANWNPAWGTKPPSYDQVAYLFRQKP